MCNRLQQRQGERAAATIEERIEHLAEDVIGRSGIEQRHRWLQLHAVHLPSHQHIDGFACLLKHSFGDFAQTGSQHCMRQVCLCFCQATYAVEVAVGVVSQATHLRKDVPDPVSAPASRLGRVRSQRKARYPEPRRNVPDWICLPCIRRQLLFVDWRTVQI